MPAFQDCNMDTLPEENKRNLYSYDCECVPLFENQLGAYQACDDLANLLGISSSPDYLIRQTVNRHYLVYPQHRKLTQVQLLRRHPAHLSLLEFTTTTTTLQTILITLTRTFCPEQLFKRQSERL